MMLRTLGIPARVVNGFRGGEYNDLTNSYIVREKDAHSWVEAYFPEYGWVTFDPTPAGPGRRTANRLVTHGALYGRGPADMARVDRQLRLHPPDEAALRPQHQDRQRPIQLPLWVERQYFRVVNMIGALQRRLEELSPRQMALCCMLLGLLLALPFAPKAWRSIQRTRALRHPQRAPRTSASFWYQRMLKMMARRGVRKEPSQTAEEFASTIPDPQCATMLSSSPSTTSAPASMSPWRTRNACRNSTRRLPDAGSASAILRLF